MLSNVTEARCEVLADIIGVKYDDKDAFIKRLGSKVIDGTGGKKNKAPHFRRLIAENVNIF